jgi:hypothetical protein
MKIKVFRIKSTLMFMKYDGNFDNTKSYYIQFSLKDPWWFPKKGTVCNGSVTLWGWLFFYVGCNTEQLKGEGNYGK